MKNEILRLDHIQSSSLYNFNLSLFRNEILGLLVREDNERHAVIDILSGVVRPDAGYIFIDDVKTQIESKTHAGNRGFTLH